MTKRLTVSLPDEVHDALVRLASTSHISTSAVVRAILADVVPKMTTVLEYLGNLDPADVPHVAEELDAWAVDLREHLHSAPDVLEQFRTSMDAPTATIAFVVHDSDSDDEP
jgi:hypothetical protein